MTAEAMAINMISVPPASGSIEPMRKAVQHPGKTAQNTANDEISDLDEAGLDAHLRGANEVTAGGNRVHSPTCLDQHELENEDVTPIAQRIWEIGLPPKILVISGPALGCHWKPA